MTKLEELRFAYETATPGEWTAPGFNSQGGAVACLLDNPDGLRLVSGNFKRPDATFIALAHNNMPALLEAVEALEKMKTSFEDLLNGYPERELHEPYQVTLNRANNLLEKLN